MAQVFLIGGAPRAGKTTALKRLITQKPTLAASTDAIRYTLRRILAKDKYPELFAESLGGFDSPENIKLMRSDPMQIVEKQNAESETVWRACLAFIQSNLEDGHDIALEGVAILPKNVVSLPFACNVHFLINRSDQTEIVKHHARSNQHDWLHNYSDEVIEAFCVFNKRQNEYFYSEVIRLGVPYTEVNNDRFQTDVEKAVQTLLINKTGG